MARFLVWSPEAIEDIESIAEFIARDSPWYAKAVASRIVELAETIPDFPELGRMVPEIGETSIRERFVHRYRIIYRLDQASVLIAAVIHGRQDFEPFLTRIRDTET
jgi:plasmid stabilization system protein ParE